MRAAIVALSPDSIQWVEEGLRRNLEPHRKLARPESPFYGCAPGLPAEGYPPRPICLIALDSV